MICYPIHGRQTCDRHQAFISVVLMIIWSYDQKQIIWKIYYSFNSKFLYLWQNPVKPNELIKEKIKFALKHYWGIEMVFMWIRWTCKNCYLKRVLKVVSNLKIAQFLTKMILLSDKVEWSLSVLVSWFYQDISQPSICLSFHLVGFWLHNLLVSLGLMWYYNLVI